MNTSTEIHVLLLGNAHYRNKNFVANLMLEQGDIGHNIREVAGLVLELHYWFQTLNKSGYETCLVLRRYGNSAIIIHEQSA
jgi:hypothetical protein